MGRKLSLLACFLVSALVTAASETTVSADPGQPRLVPGSIVTRTPTLLALRAPGPGGSRILPSDTTATALAGGVTGYSVAGMQWRQGIFFEDVQGLTQSVATATIDQIETHGSLVKGTSSDCYFGDNVWIQPSIIQNNSAYVDSGWSPFFTGSHNCWVMATGHYFIYLGSKTDVSGPDIVKQF